MKERARGGGCKSKSRVISTLTDAMNRLSGHQKLGSLRLVGASSLQVMIHCCIMMAWFRIPAQLSCIVLMIWSHAVERWHDRLLGRPQLQLRIHLLEPARKLLLAWRSTWSVKRHCCSSVKTRFSSPPGSKQRPKRKQPKECNSCKVRPTPKNRSSGSNDNFRLITSCNHLDQDWKKTATFNKNLLLALHPETTIRNKLDGTTELLISF
jgi:hypothetical protein